MWGGGSSSQARRRWNNDTAQARAAWLLACDIASRHLGADVRKVLEGSGKVGRGSDELTARTRKVACYLAMVVANASPERLAEASGFNRATIHKHGAWVEDQRDNPAFDAAIGDMENTLLMMAARVVLARFGQLDPADGAAV